MATVTLAPGETLTVEFKDSDGQFQVHFDTPEHPKQIVVKETAGLPGTDIGAAFQELYKEVFGQNDLGNEVTVRPAG